MKIRFKRSRFDLRYDLNYSQFDLKKDLNIDKPAACLPTQNEMHESSQHFCFRPMQFNAETACTVAY